MKTSFQPMNLAFQSRRSMVVAQRGMVATSHPLAAQAGLAILRNGGNAADAAIATASVLNVVESASTGIGGDCFALYYDAKTKQVSALNGSGRAPQALSIELLASKGITHAIPDRSVHAVTVPGAAAGWQDLLQKHGRMSFRDVLADAIYYAENGFPVSPVYAMAWNLGRVQTLLQNSRYAYEYLPNGKPPHTGQIVYLKELANTFRQVAEGGAEAFYQGDIAKAIISTLQEHGSVMTLRDLQAHTSTWGDPISLDYWGYQVVEHPPNGQGLAALIALNIAKYLNMDDFFAHSPEKIHLMVEAMRCAFADVRQYVGDSDYYQAPIDGLLSYGYATQRRALITPKQAMRPPAFGKPINTSDTIYLCVVDGEGNACSFINSLYFGFGSGIVAKNTGVFLQNRGANFVLDKDHPNALQGGKRPYHTIIPGMILRDGEFYANFGVMGGFMQPQGHFQVVNALIDDHLNPQEALDRPRWCLEAGTGDSVLALEEGIPIETMAKLAEYGHTVKPISGQERALFGSGQIIMRDGDGVLYGGSDPRKDGLVAGF
jgi:gamma-glutamyltranspeptidase/glutathione hydrolase